MAKVPAEEKLKREAGISYWLDAEKHLKEGLLY